MGLAEHVRKAKQRERELKQPLAQEIRDRTERRAIEQWSDQHVHRCCAEVVLNHPHIHPHLNPDYAQLKCIRSARSTGKPVVWDTRKGLPGIARERGQIQFIIWRSGDNSGNSPICAACGGRLSHTTRQTISVETLGSTTSPTDFINAYFCDHIIQLALARKNL